MHGRAIPHLMTIICAGMALVFILDNLTILPLRHKLSLDLAFSWPAICRGEIWRLFTFVFLPTNASMLLILISIYMYWLIGTALENYWGTFKFNVYYFCGIFGAILSGIITGGSATNYYLNMSLFLAFALLNPNYEMLLFFVFPVKMKWLAILDGVLIGYSAITSAMSGYWAGVAGLAFSLLNVGLFFGPKAIEAAHDYKRRKDWRDQWR